MQVTMLVGTKEHTQMFVRVQSMYKNVSVFAVAQKTLYFFLTANLFTPSLI